MGHYNLWLVAFAPFPWTSHSPSFPPLLSFTLAFSLFGLSSLVPHSLLYFTIPAGCHNVSTLGQTYTGELNVTQDGKNCLPWRATPSARGLVETCPELNGAFCRNPGQLGRKPWCFTSTAGDWEYCNVTLCSGNCGHHPPLSLSPTLLQPFQWWSLLYFEFWLSMGFG